MSFRETPLYAHLGLREWPFSVVPRPEHCTFIAGRPKLRAEINDLVAALARRDTSSIHVLWSWYGAGKTHSLYYLRNEALNRANRPIQLIPVYTEFPKGARGFIDLYRAFMACFDHSLLLDAFLEFQTTAQGDRFYEKLQLQEPDFATALRLLAMGEAPKQQVAQRWLRGEVVLASDLRAVGITQRIGNAQQATRVLCLTMKLLSDAAAVQNYYGSRVVWLVDEFRRAAKAGPATLADTNAGMHSLFNAASTGFSPVISFSGSPKSQSLPDWFSPELRDRIGTTRVMVLPPLQPSEAIQFVRDVIEHYRLQDRNRRSDFFPFNSDSCKTILDHVQSKGELRPRAIMHAFNGVLEAADPQIEKGKMSVIEPGFAKKVLAEYINVATQPEEE
jgi:hypothetical protein